MVRNSQRLRDRSRGTALVAAALLVTAVVTTWSSTASAVVGDSAVQIGPNSEETRTVPRLALDSSNNPVFAYLRPSDGYVVIHCSDRGCIDTVPVPQSIAPSPGTYRPSSIAVAVDASDHPLIALGNVNTATLDFVRCNDPQCAGGDETVITLANEDVVDISMVLDAAGNPVIAYRQLGVGTKLITCDDVACAGGETSNLLDADPSGRTTGGPVVVELDSSGNPVVATIGYPTTGDVAEADLRVTRCDDPACAGGETTVVVAGVTNIRDLDLVVPADDRPVLVSSFVPEVQPVYIRCSNPTCTTAATSLIGVRSNPFQNFGDLLPAPTIELDRDDHPIIAQHGNPTGEVSTFIVRCNDLNCQMFDSEALDGDQKPFSGEVTLPAMKLGADDSPIVLSRGFAIGAGTARPLGVTSCDDPGCKDGVSGFTPGPDPGPVEPDPDPDPGANPFVVPVAPARVFDSRAGGETIDDLFEKGGPRTAGQVTPVEIAGRANVPADAAAVVVNITSVRPVGPGFVTTYACDADQPLASSLNFIAGLNIGNELIAGVSGNGELCLLTSTQTDLTIDVVGYVPSSSPYSPLVPARLLDTRGNGTTTDGEFAKIGAIQSGDEQSLPVAGRGGVPADAAAVVVNITAINATATGFVTAHPCIDPRPGTSALNYTPGVNRGNEIIVELSGTGDICLFSSATTDLSVDVVGWLPATLDYTPVEPDRFVDTRTSGNTVDGLFLGDGKRAAGTEYRVTISGRGAIPAGTPAVVLNLTAISPESVGFVTVYDCEGTLPTASSLNHVLGVNGGNEIVAGLNGSGELCMFTSGPTHLSIDVVGFLD